MSTGTTTRPGSAWQAAKPPRRYVPRLRDTRLRTKLALLLVVPILAVLALAGLRIFDINRAANTAALVRDLTRLSAKVSDLAHQLHRERMAAASYLASPNAAPDAYDEYVVQTDTSATAYGTARKGVAATAPAVLNARLSRIDGDLHSLDGIRAAVHTRSAELTSSEVMLRYGILINELLSYGGVLGQFVGAGPIANEVRAVSAFTKAKAGTAEEEAVAFTALSSGQPTEEQYTAFLATRASRQEASLTFSLGATSEQRILVDKTVTGHAVVLADQAVTAIGRSVGHPAQITAADAARSIGAVTDLMRWAEIQLQARLLEHARTASADASRRATIEAIVILVTLLVAIAIAMLLARSLDGSLRRLREGALAVATRDLPDAVARLRDIRNIRDSAAEDVIRDIGDPIQLNNRDEIGQVAQAFNVVHREAVRIAAEQAALRTTVSAMFLNLARRSQSLVDRMIGQLDRIERGEEDPERLAQLFELDHLATRMRRNDENILVLAGADSSAPRREDALLIDALRAAQSEVELYDRIGFGAIDPDMAIAAHAVNDVVRLVAELLDNATRFSPPRTVVVADACRVNDDIVVRIEDRGLGMNVEQMTALNVRLAQPSGVDVSAFRLMGLAVVSRLAGRYGIRVELRANVEGGTVASVTLPREIVVLPALDPGPTLDLGPGPEPSGRGLRTVEEGSTGGRDVQPPTPRGSVATLSPPAAIQAEPAPAREPAAGGAESGVASLGAPTEAFISPTAAYPIVRSLEPIPTPASDPEPFAVDVDVDVDVDAAVTPSATEPVSPRTSGWGSTLSALPPPVIVVEEYTEAPILPSVETKWFSAYDPESDEWPTAGYAPPPSSPVTLDGDEDITGSAVQANSSARTATPVTTEPDARPALPVRIPGASTLRPPDPGTAPPLGGTPSDGFQSSPGQSGPGQSGPGQSGPGQSGAGQSAAGRPGSELPGPKWTDGDPPPEDGLPGAGQPTTGRPGSGASAEVPAPEGPIIPRQRAASGQPWQTAADEGWSRASAAVNPATAGTTRSGLPKRVPQAQLVPGGVRPNAGERRRRTPGEVRGLLSAYHRGVQRGRTEGAERGADIAPVKEIEQ